MKNAYSNPHYHLFKRLFALLFLWSIALPPMSAQVSLNMELQSNWDDNNITTISGVDFNDIWGYLDENGNEYAILGSTQYTHFIDISNPENPIEVERIAGNSNSLWRDFKTYSHYAYGVADQGSPTLQIFDLSDLPNSVTKVYDSNSHFPRCHNIFIDEPNARLYAVGTNTEDLVVLDLSITPDNPTLLKNINLSAGYIHDIFVRDHIAYCSHIYVSQLQVYDLSDVNNVINVGSLTSYSNKGLNHSNWVSEDNNTLVLADENHNKALKIVDISDLSDIKEISTIKSTLMAPDYTNSIPHNPFIYGNDYVFISYYHDGIQLYNISDPENPFCAAYYDTNTTHSNYSGYKGCWGVYPYLPSGNIIGSDVRNGLFVVRTTFPLEDCSEQVNIGGRYSDEWTFSANATLESDATITSNGNLSFKAPNYHLLKPGFESENGSVLQLLLEDACGDSNMESENEAEDSPDSKTNSENIVLQVNSYPNPFHTVTLIQYTIPNENTDVKLHVFNSNGQKIQTLVNTKRHKSGTFKMPFDARNLPTGLYYYAFRANDFTQTGKLLKQ